METRRKKRFIAGATCPKCHAMDTMMLYMEHGVEKVDCVACGHSQSQTDTRVSEASGGTGEVIGLFKPQ